jgi:hypothetical protein
MARRHHHQHPYAVLETGGDTEDPVAASFQPMTSQSHDLHCLPLRPSPIDQHY